MDDIPHQPNSSPSKTSLPTFARSIPLEIAALPASTRTSFTRVDDNTRPGTAAGDLPNNNHNHLPDEPPVPGPGTSGGGGDGADARSAPPPPPENGQEEEVTGAAVVPQVPQTLVQFLLVSGRRRSMAFDPETTVGRVKELLWNTWPNDWQDEHPPAPSHLRVLYLGKILQDDETLTQLKFPSYTPPEPATPTIVHLSIRSFVPREDTSLKKKRRLSRSGSNANQTGTGTSQDENGTGCCCVIC